MGLHLHFASLLPALLVILIALIHRKWDVGEMVSRAIEGSAMKRREAAQYYGTSESVLTQAITGKGSQHLSLDRLTNMPESFWCHFIIEVGEQIRLIPPAATRARRMARATCRAASASSRHVHQGVRDAEVA